MYSKLKYSEDLKKFKSDIKKLKANNATDEMLYRYMDRELRDNLPLFCQIMLPLWYTKDFGNCHFDLFNMLVSQNEKVVIAFPRKHGKTTCMKGYVLWNIVYQHEPFILWLGNSADAVEAHFLNCLVQLEQNKLIRSVYGDLKGLSLKWGKTGIKLKNGFRLDTISKNQSMRGILDDRPPTLMIVDDLDDDETAYSKLQRDRLDQWFFNNALPAIDQELGKVRMIGTCLHEDCELMRIINNPSWESTVKSAVDNMTDFNPLWAEFFTKEKLWRKKESLYNARPVPKVQTWWQEWMNQPKNAEASVWSLSNLKWWQGEYDDGYIVIRKTSGEVVERRRVNTITAVDLASTYSKTSDPDYTVVMTAGIDVNFNIYILECYAKQWAKPTDYFTEMFNHHIRYNTSDVFIEVIGSATNGLLSIWEDMAEKRVREGKSVPTLNPITSRRGAKEDKISSTLEAKLKYGLIHLKKGMEDIYHELDTFPQGSHDDRLDALSDLAAYGLPAEEEKGEPSVDYNDPLYTDDSIDYYKSPSTPAGRTVAW